MKRLFSLLVGVLFTLVPVLVMAAGTVVAGHVKNYPHGIKSIAFTCTGDSSNGSFPSDVDTGRDLKGFIFLVVTNPGTTAPTADYDIVLNDGDGIDIMGGELGDRSATVSEQAIPLIDAAFGSRYVFGRVTPVITNNSVNSAVIVLTIYYYTE